MSKPLQVLEIPVILEHIFQYCSAKDLESCRQVSKAWKAISAKFINSKTRVILTQRNTVSFLQLVRNSINLDSQSGIFNQFQIGGPFNSTPFWKICGSSIKVLVLLDCTFPTVDGFRAAVFEQCPNLHDLTLRRVSTGSFSKSNLAPDSDVNEPLEWTENDKVGGCKVNKNLKCLQIQRRSGALEISWMEMFSHFPAIQKLVLFGCDVNDDNLFQSISKIRQKNPRNLKLKEIFSLNDNSTSHSPTVCYNLANLISDATLPLETLAMGVNGQSVISWIEKLVRAHPNTLTFLEVYKNASIPDSDGATTTTTNLFQAGKKNIVIKPSLTKLTIRGRQGQNPFIFNHGDLSSRSLPIILTKCNQLTIDIVTSESDLHQLARFLPNVNKLQISNLDNIKLACVILHWPTLIQLIIRESQVNEVGITGIQRDHQPNRLPDPTMNRNKPNLTNLKELQLFAMTASDGQTSLAYSAAEKGFELASKLKQLCISDYMLDNPHQWDLWQQRMERERSMEIDLF